MTAALYLRRARATGWRRRVLYVAASLGFWGGNQFYDSLLTDVAEEQDYDLVSGYGYSLGYLGGGLLFLVNVLMVTKPAMFGIADASEGVRLSFLTVGVWWLRVHRAGAAVREGDARGARVAVRRRHSRRRARAGQHHSRTCAGDKTLLWFLLAYWFYIDGVNTIIKMAVDYGLSLGLEQASLITALLLVQFVGFPGGAGVRLAGQEDRPAHGHFHRASGCIRARRSTRTSWTRRREFFVLAIVIGLVQGGVQSLSRSLFGRLVPAGKSGEFFGFYNLMGKAAAILGPLLTGVVALTTHDSRLAIVSISILFVIGAVFLSRVRIPANSN